MKALLVLLTAALLTGCSTGHDAVDVNNGGEFRYVAATPAGEVIPEDQRASAPEFGGTLLNGDAFASAKLAGQVAVLNFWGSWCPPCRVETPEFSEVSEDYGDAGVQFLGINVKEQDKQFAEAFIEDKGIHFPSLYDPRRRQCGLASVTSLTYEDDRLTGVGYAEPAGGTPPDAVPGA